MNQDILDEIEYIKDWCSSNQIALFWGSLSGADSQLLYCDWQGESQAEDDMTALKEFLEIANRLNVSVLICDIQSFAITKESLGLTKEAVENKIRMEVKTKRHVYEQTDHRRIDYAILEDTSKRLDKLKQYLYQPMSYSMLFNQGSITYRFLSLSELAVELLDIQRLVDEQLFVLDEEKQALMEAEEKELEIDEDKFEQLARIVASDERFALTGSRVERNKLVIRLAKETDPTYFTDKKLHSLGNSLNILNRAEMIYDLEFKTSTEEKVIKRISDLKQQGRKKKEMLGILNISQGVLDRLYPFTD